MTSCYNHFDLTFTRPCQVCVLHLDLDGHVCHEHQDRHNHNDYCCCDHCVCQVGEHHDDHHSYNHHNYLHYHFYHYHYDHDDDDYYHHYRALFAEYFL